MEAGGKGSEDKTVFTEVYRIHIHLKSGESLVIARLSSFESAQTKANKNFLLPFILKRSQATWNIFAAK